MKSYHSKMLETRFGIFRISWAAPGTCWHAHGFTPKERHILRHDQLFGVSRTLLRALHEYIWRIHIGPLMITCWYFPKETR